MSRHRLFCSRKRIVDGLFTIAGEEAHHGVNVCRLRPGDEVFVFTEQGSEFRCEVEAARKGQLKARIIEKLTDEVESPLAITLIQAVPKAARLEQIIVHATELGLSRLVLVQSERAFRGERPDRWRRMALEAAKQSGRRMIPRIEPAVPFDKLDFDGFTDSLKLLACEKPCAGSLSRIAAEHGGVGSVVIASGPEGGFTEAEMRRLLEAGFLCISMGPRVLRTETASLALMAAVQCLLGDWEPKGGAEPQCGL
ncbi:MAG TPA: RsmE family RNA methyltransferase [Acidobacteriota bacterium]|nr:RsmE family RNA methyltransferase [Acidobacteriota bacterium]